MNRGREGARGIYTTTTPWRAAVLLGALALCGGIAGCTDSDTDEGNSAITSTTAVSETTVLPALSPRAVSTSFSHPDWSPDGRLAIILQLDVYLVDPDTGETELVSPEQFSLPSTRSTRIDHDLIRPDPHQFVVSLRGKSGSSSVEVAGSASGA